MQEVCDSNFALFAQESRRWICCKKGGSGRSVRCPPTPFMSREHHLLFPRIPSKTVFFNNLQIFVTFSFVRLRRSMLVRKADFSVLFSLIFGCHSVIQHGRSRQVCSLCSFCRCPSRFGSPLQLQAQGLIFVQDTIRKFVNI